MNAPSLSISLQTATDASAFLLEEDESNSKSKAAVGNLFQKAKYSQEKSCLYTNDEDSMIRELCQDPMVHVDQLPRRDLNQQVFNIIDCGYHQQASENTLSSQSLYAMKQDTLRHEHQLL